MYAFLKLARLSNKGVTDRIPVNSDEFFVSESVLGVFFGALTFQYKTKEATVLK